MNINQKLEIKRHVSNESIYTPTVQLYGAVVLFMVATRLSRGGAMSGLETDIFYTVYTLPDWLRPLFFVITQFGSIYMLGTLLGLYLLWKKYSIVLRMLMTGLLAYVVSGFAKDIWGRDRPSDLLPDVAVRDYMIRGPGYPSGHTALAVALALTIAFYVPKHYKLPVILFGLVGVGLSRVYLGVHAPLDIVGGAAIGWASYALFRHVALRDLTKKAKKSDKKHTKRKR